MHRVILLFVSLVLVVCQLHAQKPIPALKEIDGDGKPVIVFTKITAKPGELIPIRAQTDGKVVEWKAVTSGISLIPSDFLRDTKVTVALALRPGTYVIHAVTARGDVPSAITEVQVVVSDNPEPEPPLPPDDNAIAGQIRKLYQSDNSENKFNTLGKLNGFYKAVLGHMRKPAVKTVEDFKQDFEMAANEILCDLDETSLIGIRRFISSKLLEVLGKDLSQNLDPNIRPKAITLLTDITNALSAIETATVRKK
jgi:hypothetical protein